MNYDFVFNVGANLERDDLTNFTENDEFSVAESGFRSERSKILPAEKELDATGMLGAKDGRSAQTDAYLTEKKLTEQQMNGSQASFVKAVRRTVELEKSDSAGMSFAAGQEETQMPSGYTQQPPVKSSKTQEQPLGTSPQNQQNDQHLRQQIRSVGQQESLLTQQHHQQQHRQQLPPRPQLQDQHQQLPPKQQWDYNRQCQLLEHQHHQQQSPGLQQERRQFLPTQQHFRREWVTSQQEQHLYYHQQRVAAQNQGQSLSPLQLEYQQPLSEQQILLTLQQQQYQQLLLTQHRDCSQQQQLPLQQQTQLLSLLQLQHHQQQPSGLQQQPLSPEQQQEFLKRLTSEQQQHLHYHQERLPDQNQVQPLPTQPYNYTQLLSEQHITTALQMYQQFPFSEQFHHHQRNLPAPHQQLSLTEQEQVFDQQQQLALLKERQDQPPKGQQEFIKENNRTEVGQQSNSRNNASLHVSTNRQKEENHSSSDAKKPESESCIQVRT